MKTCPTCGVEIMSGREDKKFCSPTCKSAYQYEVRKKEDSFYFEVDRALKTNRKILKKYNVKGYTTVRKLDLIEEGFNPNYFTHYWKNKEGKVYLFVYDHGFLEIHQKGISKLVLVEWQDYMRK